MMPTRGDRMRTVDHFAKIRQARRRSFIDDIAAVKELVARFGKENLAKLVEVL